MAEKLFLDTFFWVPSRCIKQEVRMYQTRSEDVSEARTMETRVLVLLSLVQGYLTTLWIDTSLVLSFSLSLSYSLPSSLKHQFISSWLSFEHRTQFCSDSTPFHANIHIDCILILLHPDAGNEERKNERNRSESDRRRILFLFVRKFMATFSLSSSWPHLHLDRAYQQSCTSISSKW